MKELNLKTGKVGENIAREYLEKKGYKIVEQNYRSKFAEIDLVVKRGNELVFVEVRTKRGEMFGRPEDTLNGKKMVKLKKNARAYTGRIDWRGLCRIDAVCVVLDKSDNAERLDHYENIG